MINREKYLLQAALTLSSQVQCHQESDLEPSLWFKAMLPSLNQRLRNKRNNEFVVITLWDLGVGCRAPL
jgi:hypothetical protein